MLAPVSTTSVNTAISNHQSPIPTDSLREVVPAGVLRYRTIGERWLSWTTHPFSGIMVESEACGRARRSCERRSSLWRYASEIETQTLND